MDTAVPVACIVVCEGSHDGRPPDQMGVVETRAAQVASHLELSYLREGLNCRRLRHALIVTRQGQVHAGTPFTGGNEADGISHHGVCARKIIPLGMV